ncbi:MAG: ribosomal protein S18-alanine N-acetyltransferase [Xanthomonadales bacterium]|nr:ribosomal protein S18-alanine N-acetyltransferase [Xanthomonadales bacterium]
MSAVLKPPAPAMRPMTERDVDQVLRIEQSAYPYPWSAGIFRDCLRVGYSCWILELEDQLLGYGILSSGAGEAHILNLCIDPRQQGKGYGLRLLDRLIDLARWHHARSIFLEVRPSNQRAIDMYRQRGFENVGRRPNYYPAENGREDAIIMAMKLAPEGVGSE